MTIFWLSILFVQIISLVPVSLKVEIFPYFDKFLHFFVFLFLSYIVKSKKKQILYILGLVVFIFLIELEQYILPFRESEIYDLIFGLAGVLVGYLFSPDFITKLFSSFFFTGFSPFAPATFSSFIFCLVLYFLKISSSIFIMGFPLIFLFSIYLSDKAEKIWGEDAKKIVIDEITGLWISFVIFNPLNFKIQKMLFVLYFLNFIFFRFFDIYKPYPIKDLQGYKGGIGVVMDDLIAGIYAGVFSLIFYRFLNFFFNI